MRWYLLSLLVVAFAFTPRTTCAVPIKITCVGDSLTEGNGATDQNTTSYPAVLGSLLQGLGEYQIGNFGYGGANLLPYAGTFTYTNTSKFVPGVNFAGDTIIIMLGTNDGASEGGSQHHLDEFTNSYDLLIQHYTAGRNPVPRIIVATPPWVPIAGGPWNQDTIHNKICPIVRSYAATRGYTLVDINLLTWNHPEWSSDGMVHYNDAGYQAMANAFFSAVTNTSITPLPLAVVIGNSNSIPDGSVTSSTTNGTAFGAALVAGVTVDHTFRIQNNGTTNLTLTGSPIVAIVGTHTADFAVISQPVSTVISAGAFAEFTLRFDPTASGSRQASVSIENSDTFRSPYDFAISGTGTQPPPTAFTAYNDVAWINGQLSNSITTLGIGSSGALVDYASGSQLGVQVSLTGLNASLWPGSGAGFAPSGTAAADMLPTNRVDSVIHYLFDSATLTFSGLTPTNFYTFGFYANRDGGYTDRYTTVEIQSADGFTNNSSVGAVSQTATTTTIFTGSSHGQVFRYDRVNPGTDGTVTFQFSGYKPCLNSFVLQTPSTNPAGSTNSPPSTTNANWTAYNDAAWHQDPNLFPASPGVDVAATTFSTNSPWALNSGLLKSTTGDTLPVTASYSGNSSPSMLARSLTIPDGTDLATCFAGNIGTNNAMTWPNGTLTLTLSGLNTAKQYTVALWSSRGGTTTAYSNRWTDITIKSVDSFTNTSSAGLTKLTSSISHDQTRVVSVIEGGRIARFDAIRTGADGTIVFDLTANGLVGTAETNGYLNAFMIQEFDALASIVSDGNNNGMDDAWEQIHFGSTNAPNGGMLQDWDLDGFDNYSEYRAGTSPTNANSLLAFSGLQSSATNTLVLAWPGVNGKTYSIQNNTNLTTPWTTQQSGIPGVQPMTVHTVGVSSLTRTYWRVKVE